MVHIHYTQNSGRELEDFGEQAVDGKERSACVHRGGHKTPNFRISLSFTNTLTTSITSESLPGSEQSSTAGTLSPSLMQSLGGGKMTITPPAPGAGTTFGEPCLQQPYFSNAPGMLPWPIFTHCEAHRADCLPSPFAGRWGKGRSVRQI